MRKLPVAIATDDEDEDLELLEAPRSKPVPRDHRNHGQETDDQSVDTSFSKEGQSDEDDFDDGADDLQGLDDGSLIMTLCSEVIFLFL